MVNIPKQTTVQVGFRIESRVISHELFERMNAKINHKNIIVNTGLHGLKGTPVIPEGTIESDLLVIRSGFNEKRQISFWYLDTRHLVEMDFTPVFEWIIAILSPLSDDLKNFRNCDGEIEMHMEAVPSIVNEEQPIIDLNKDVVQFLAVNSITFSCNIYVYCINNE